MYLQYIVKNKSYMAVLILWEFFGIFNLDSQSRILTMVSFSGSVLVPSLSPSLVFVCPFVFAFPLVFPFFFEGGVLEVTAFVPPLEGVLGLPTTYSSSGTRVLVL